MSCETRSLTLDLLAFDFLEGRERERVADHAGDCPECSSSLVDRREEREIITFVLAMDPVSEPATVPVTRSLTPAFLGAAVAAALLLLLVGPALLLPRYEMPPTPPAPADPLLSPDLTARVRVLEERIEKLATEAVATERVLPADPREAIAAYDWDRLADLLVTVNPELAKGRVPDDTRILVRYVESLKELTQVTEAAGLSADLRAVSRDPRTGPLLFGAVIRRAWPEVAPADVAVAEEAARQAMTEYASEVAAAETKAGVAVAEERLAENLAREVEKVEERYGEPEVDVTPIVVTPTAVKTDTAGKEAVLAAVEPVDTSDRIVSGTPESVAEEMASLLAKDLGLSAPALSAITTQWVANYRAVLDRAPVEVVEVLAANLTGRRGETTVPASAVHRLRSALLATQATAEDRLSRRLDARSRGRLKDVSRPTFFLITSQEFRLKLGR